MTCSIQKTLGFSEPFLKVECLQNVEHLVLNDRSIVLNAADKGLLIEGITLKPWDSSIFSNTNIDGAAQLICISLSTDLLSAESFPYTSALTKKWTHAYDLFQLPHLKDIKLWRSDKDSIDGIEFNLWYAAAGTNCGIHKKHDFRELHTQIFGIGRMQKFHENDHNTIYQDVFMSPGHTHEPFYYNDGVYPWHQYYADTDCIWLACEF